MILRDSTLREGLDTPGVTLSLEQRLRIAELLAEAGVPEAEVVAPSRVAKDLEVARAIKSRGMRIQLSGLIYAYSDRCTEEIALSCDCLDWVTLLMPLSAHRKPASPHEKVAMMRTALERAVERTNDIGVGFPHSTQADLEFLVSIGEVAVSHGARRITVYDTNGSSDPFRTKELVERLSHSWDADIYFHGHNDLGLATANALAAVAGGASGLDVTVNGLGDRAGNASLEQVVVNLSRAGRSLGVRTGALTLLSQAVAEMTGVAVSGLAPVVGEYVFMHKSPSHLQVPELFEAFDPGIVGARRRLVE
jgi:isopropylmalate/homocitrate/citramalate synthase